MKTFILSVSVLAMALSCSKKTEAIAVKNTDSTGVFSDTESVADSTLSATSHCYILAKGNDTLFASIDDNLGTISGKLYYKNANKEHSYGEILGFSTDDTIKVDYSYHSNGAARVKEIWFLKKDNKLYEGTGKYDASGEKYASGKSVTFDTENYLKSEDCKIINPIITAAEVKSQTPPSDKQ